jgi:hypothetical protein
LISHRRFIARSPQLLALVLQAPLTANDLHAA